MLIFSFANPLTSCLMEWHLYGGFRVRNLIRKWWTCKSKFEYNVTAMVWAMTFKTMLLLFPFPFPFNSDDLFQYMVLIAQTSSDKLSACQNFTVKKTLKMNKKCQILNEMYQYSFIVDHKFTSFAWKLCCQLNEV